MIKETLMAVLIIHNGAYGSISSSHILKYEDCERAAQSLMAGLTKYSGSISAECYPFYEWREE